MVVAREGAEPAGTEPSLDHVHVYDHVVREPELGRFEVSVRPRQVCPLNRSR